MNRKELKEFLDAKVVQYNTPDFIPHDPIQIPHLFTDKEDIEIASFLVATIAWGNRKSIINNSNKLMNLMDNAPADFIKNHVEKDLDRFDGFVHRTFNSEDCKTFIRSLQHIDINYGGLEHAFAKAYQSATNEELDDDIKTSYDSMLEAIKKAKKKEVIDKKAELKSLLTDEIVKRYFYKEGLYNYQIKYNPEIRAAIEVLNDEGKYNRILK